MKNLFEDYLNELGMLTDEEIQIVVADADFQNKQKGKFLLKAGQVATQCYLVLKGCVREYYIKDGEEKSTSFFLEGDSISSFTSQKNNVPSKSYLECIEDCILLVSNDDMEKEICRKIPRLESLILQEVEQITGRIQDKLVNFMTSSPEERYISLLENKPELLRRVPQHQIASFIGIQPESLSRLRKRILSKQ